MVRIKDHGERRALRILAECDPGHMVRGHGSTLMIDGGRQAGKTMRLLSRLADRVGELAMALREWKCPSCDGSGTSDVPRFVDGVWTEGVFPCRSCRSTGLHPTAAKALGEEREPLA